LRVGGEPDLVVDDVGLLVASGKRAGAIASHALARERPPKLLLTAGALASALASIVGLTGTVQSYFNDPAEGSVSLMTIKGVNTLTYGEWRSHEHGPNIRAPVLRRNRDLPPGAINGSPLRTVATQIFNGRGP
jgi:hypothetical protein